MPAVTLPVAGLSVRLSGFGPFRWAFVLFVLRYGSLDTGNSGVPVGSVVPNLLVGRIETIISTVVLDAAAAVVRARPWHGGTFGEAPAKRISPAEDANEVAGLWASAPAESHQHDQERSPHRQGRHLLDPE